MPLPKDLFLLRHGQSESNIVQKGGEDIVVPKGFAERHDSNARLSSLGVEQARNAGEWFRNNGLSNFQRFYVSPHVRTRETAANLALNGDWIIDDLWRERDWGEYGAVPKRSEQQKLFPYSYAIKKLSEWYWKPVGGESMATGVRYRVNSVLDTLRRLDGVNSVIGVTHGEFIRTMQFVLEGLTPGEWMQMDDNPEYSIKNCMVVHYSRIDPETGEEHPTFRFRRMINTFDEAASPDGGRWTKITIRKFSDEELLASLEAYPPLFPREK